MSLQRLKRNATQPNGLSQDTCISVVEQSGPHCPKSLTPLFSCSETCQRCRLQHDRECTMATSYLHDFVQLASFAISRDESIVGGGVGCVALIQHAPVHCHGLPGLVAHVACDDERVIGPQNWLHTLQLKPTSAKTNLLILLLLYCSVLIAHVACNDGSVVGLHFWLDALQWKPKSSQCQSVGLKCCECFAALTQCGADSCDRLLNA